MAQSEVYDYLATLRKRGDERFYSVREIYQCIKDKTTERTIFSAVVSLTKRKCLEYDHETVLMDVLNNRPITRRYRATIR